MKISKTQTDNLYYIGKYAHTKKLLNMLGYVMGLFPLNYYPYEYMIAWYDHVMYLFIIIYYEIGYIVNRHLEDIYIWSNSCAHS